MLDIRDLEVTYRAGENEIRALGTLNLHIGKSEYAAILGPNGSGKSTLIKAICGLVPLRSGEIKFSGMKVVHGRFGEELFGRIAVVLQEPTGQFLMPTVELEIGTVLQNLGLSNQEQKESFDHVVDILSLRPLLPKNPQSLSGGQMQLVNLACALAVSPEMILLDEPTTFLDAYYRNLLLEFVDTLHRSGIAVLHVTQYPDEALRAGRVLILDSGQMVADGKPNSLLSDAEMLVRHRLAMPRNLAAKKWLGIDYSLPKPDASQDAGLVGMDRLSRAKMRERQADSFLLVNDLRFSYGRGQFSMEVEKLCLHRDELVGLIGPAGSGKSTMAFLMAALLKPDGGDVLIGGAASSEMQVRAIRQHVGITWQMPDPAFIGPTVVDEIDVTAKNLLSGEVDMDRTLLRAGMSGSGDRIVDTLSGGEKRKLSLACALTGDPDYLILDEPSAFLDPAAQTDLQQTIRSLSGSKKGVMIIGHDIPFISELVDRVIGLRDGVILFDLPAAEFFSDPAYIQMLGLPEEPLISFRRRLAEKGVKIPFGSLDPRRLAEFLKESGIRWREFA